MEKKAHNGSCGCTEGRIMERDTQKGTDSGAKDKIAAQAKDSGPGPPSPYSARRNTFPFPRRSSQRRSTSAWICAMSSFPRGSRKRWRKRP
jgi:hypothetical protein